jgi:hypothetical protein
MSDTFYERPILNSPYEYPARHRGHAGNPLERLLVEHAHLSVESAGLMIQVSLESVQTGFEPSQRLIDSIEPFFGHKHSVPGGPAASSSRPGDAGEASDDTSSAARREAVGGMSSTRGKWVHRGVCGFRLRALGGLGDTARQQWRGRCSQ